MGADIGDTGDLQQTLNGAVFAVGAVKHRKHHIDALAHHAVIFKTQKTLTVDRGEGGTAIAVAILPGTGGQHAVVIAAEQNPVAFLGDADRENVIFIVIDVVQNGLGRTKRDFMLRRNTAEQNANTKLSQGLFLFS